MFALALFILLVLLTFKRRRNTLSCGLYGVASTYFGECDLDLFKSLGLLNCFRGTDSVGVFSVDKKGNKYKPVYLKKAVHPVTLLESRHADGMMRNKSCILAGHNRAATKGSVVDANAHPFCKKHILGMHNGTVHSLAEKDTTDSEKLFDIMAEKGLQAAVDAAKYGAYALVWVDNQKATLNFLRNEQRPLWFAKTKSGTIAWSSERRTFDFLKEREDIFEDITMLPANEHWSMKYGTINLVKVVDMKPTHVPVSSHFKSTADKWHTVVSNFRAGYPYTRPRESNVVRLPGLPSPPSATEEMGREAMGTSIQYKGYQGTSYAIRFIKKALESGCECCTSNLSDTHDTVHWIGHDQYVCDDCMTRGVFKEQLGNRPSYVGKLEWTH